MQRISVCLSLFQREIGVCEINAFHKLLCVCMRAMVFGPAVWLSLLLHALMATYLANNAMWACVEAVFH